MNEIIQRVSLSEEKRVQFEKAWPDIFKEYLHRTFQRMGDIEKYMQSSLEKIKKT